MPDIEKSSILERLETEFEQEKNQLHTLETTEKKVFRIEKDFFNRHRKKIFSAFLALVVLAAVSAVIWANINQRQEKSKISNGAPEFLSEEEKEDWEKKTVDTNEIYITVNTNLDVQENNTVQLRLANPPYCAYPIKITIVDTDTGETAYYESEVMEPGSSIEEAELKNLPEKAGSYQAKIRYQFFAEKNQDTVVGEHTVSAEIIIH